MEQVRVHDLAPNLSRRSSRSGFSLTQTLVALALIGILGGLAVPRWTLAGRKQALILEGKSLRAFFQEARAYGVKKNLQVGIRFDPSAGSSLLFEDRNGNGAPDAGEAVRTVPFGKGIEIGIAPGGPTQGPAGLAAPASGLAGAWAQAWTAPADMPAAPPAGGLFLRHQRLRVFAICLHVTAASQQVALSLWDGRSWIAL
jgi:type II secretory pathway pseudopilin PulG